MNATMTLLARWMDAKGHENQSEAARALGIKPAAVNNWTRGVSQAAPHLIERMAIECGEQPAPWLALVESERSRDAADRKTWATLAKQLGAAAAIAAVAVVALPELHSVPEMSAMHIMSIAALIMMALARRWWHPTAPEWSV